MGLRSMLALRMCVSRLELEPRLDKSKKRPQRGLNFILVRETGLEPARPKAYAPKAYVYTNFTTRAKRKCYNDYLSKKTHKHQ